MGGDMPNGRWLALREISHPDDDLVNIFQRDIELVDRAEGLDDWWAFPEHAGLLPAESSQEKSPTRLSFDGMMSPVTSDAYIVSNITFYLVPRQGDHFILGKLAHMLRRLMVEICQNYAWQLRFLSVRPSYLQWTLGDFPEFLTQEMLQIIRGETSQQIFENFPDLLKGMTIRDYWASGYLMDLENSEFSTQALLAHFAQGSSRVLKPG